MRRTIAAVTSPALVTWDQVYSECSKEFIELLNTRAMVKGKRRFRALSLVYCEPRRRERDDEGEESH
jgi:hypothetical protein